MDPYEASIPQVIPGSVLLMPPGVGFSVGWFRLRSGTLSQPVNQEADRLFALVFYSG